MSLSSRGTGDGASGWTDPGVSGQPRAGKGYRRREAVADGQQQEKKQEGATEALNHPKNVKPGQRVGTGVGNVKPCERIETGVGVFYRAAL